MTQQIDKPFSAEYVVSVTKRHMLKDIDVSIAKTVARISEFAEDPEKSREIFNAIATLQQMKNMVRGMK